MHASTNVRTHAHTHTHTHKYAHTHTYTRARTRTHTHTHTHIHHTQMHTHTRTHTHTYTHTHTHTSHTHTHTHWCCAGLRRLLERGATVDVRSKESQKTPLHIACQVYLRTIKKGLFNRVLPCMHGNVCVMYVSCMCHVCVLYVSCCIQSRCRPYANRYGP